MGLKKIITTDFKKDYSKGYSLGLDPYITIEKSKTNKAFLTGFNSGRIDYELMNGKLVNGIPKRIVTNKVLEDFLIAGLLGLRVDTEDYTIFQLNVMAKWYQSGTEKYNPHYSDYLIEILENNGIDIK